jgi:hypothetical protein
VCRTVCRHNASSWPVGENGVGRFRVTIVDMMEEEERSSATREHNGDQE